MENKLVVIVNSLKVPKIKKILLYGMKFLVPNYNCLQNPWLGGYPVQNPSLSVLCPQLNLLNPLPPEKKFLGTPLSATMLRVKEKNYSHTGRISELHLSGRLLSRNSNYPYRLGTSGKFVHNPTKLTGLEITVNWIKPNTVLWLVESAIRRGRKV